MHWGELQLQNGKHSPFCTMFSPIKSSFFKVANNSQHETLHSSSTVLHLKINPDLLHVMESEEHTQRSRNKPLTRCALLVHSIHCDVEMMYVSSFTCRLACMASQQLNDKHCTVLACIHCTRQFFIHSTLAKMFTSVAGSAAAASGRGSNNSNNNMQQQQLDTEVIASTNLEIYSLCKVLSLSSSSSSSSAAPSSVQAATTSPLKEVGLFVFLCKKWFIFHLVFDTSIPDNLFRTDA